MQIIRFLAATGLLLSAPAYADFCVTSSEGCSGLWQELNNFPQPRCYVVFWANQQSFSNFCVQPGQTARENVQYGDKYCVETGFTPNPYTCSRRSFPVE